MSTDQARRAVRGYTLGLSAAFDRGLRSGRDDGPIGNPYVRAEHRLSWQAGFDQGEKERAKPPVTPHKIHETPGRTTPVGSPPSPGDKPARPSGTSARFEGTW